MKTIQSDANVSIEVISINYGMGGGLGIELFFISKVVRVLTGVPKVFPVISGRQDDNKIAIHKREETEINAGSR